MGLIAKYGFTNIIKGCNMDKTNFEIHDPIFFYLDRHRFAHYSRHFINYKMVLASAVCKIRWCCDVNGCSFEWLLRGWDGFTLVGNIHKRKLYSTFLSTKTNTFYDLLMDGFTDFTCVVEWYVISWSCWLGPQRLQFVCCFYCKAISFQNSFSTNSKVGHC